MAEAMDIDDDQIAGDENANAYKSPAEKKSLSAKQEKRLEFLLEQAEIFSHFIGKSPKQQAKRKISSQRNAKKAKSSNNRHHNSSQSQDDDADDDDDDDDGANRMKTSGIRFDTTPSYIQGEMRDYQLRGLNWLISLYECHVNGILADEMGLGKTLQTISILGFLKHYEKINGKFLVIGPKSTVRNWYNEVNRFCPSLEPLILIGDKGARSDTLHKMKTKRWDVCLTTYEMCLSESGPLKRIEWQYLVVDEAHRLKNENSKLSKTLRLFQSNSRLLLTGTPLQNNLHELWALLNFLLPDVFASADDFDTWFDSNDCLKGNNDIAHRLRDILRPFMLRRIKAEVEKSLLPKIELKLFVGMTSLQRETYKKVLAKEITKMNEMGEETNKAITMIVQELRKAANHPYLIEGIEPGPPYTTDQHLVNNCGKMMVLDKLLVKLKSQGSRVVLFSQYVIMLDILEDYLIWRGHEYRRLDGQTPYEDRVSGIDEFNAEGSKVFIYIISTRAGGLGINLATADTVIIYDSDWNPQPDFQAIDRVHRIGQKKQVRVFRLVTENTIDERIVQRAEIKQRLDRMIIQQGRSSDKNTTELSKGMKRDMIRFGADQIMSENAADVIDVDIEQILKYGETKTANEHSEYAKLGESELRNLTLEEASSVSVYQFEGVDFRQKKKKSGENNDLYEFRQRKIVQYTFVPTVSVEHMPRPPPRKLKYLPEFQFYPQELVDLSEANDRWVDMAENTEHKVALLSQGFPNWKRNDLKLFCDAMTKYARNDIVNIATMLPDKSVDEVARYHATFWRRAPTELSEFHRLIAPLKKKEAAESNEKHFGNLLKWKIEQYRYPQTDMTFTHLKRKNFTQEQDTFLVNSLYKYGIDAPSVYDRIRQDILKSKRFMFDFFMRSRTAAELQQRAKAILLAITQEQANKHPTGNLNLPKAPPPSNVLKPIKTNSSDKVRKSKSWTPHLNLTVSNNDDDIEKENPPMASTSKLPPTSSGAGPSKTVSFECETIEID